MVGNVGFEPTISCSQSRRLTGLGQSPIKLYDILASRVLPHIRYYLKYPQPDPLKGDFLILVETEGIEPSSAPCKGASFPLAYVPIKLFIHLL
jgi:hypothetical protein